MRSLENNLATRAFAPDRVQVLHLLSSQMAISLENNLLFEERLRAEVPSAFSPSPPWPWPSPSTTRRPWPAALDGDGRPAPAASLGKPLLHPSAPALSLNTAPIPPIRACLPLE
ncbi:hypothetical protein ACN28S_22275 [Cystobacter fuscus]